jgi:hypothetical protein
MNKHQQNKKIHEKLQNIKSSTKIINSIENNLTQSNI